MGVVLTPIVDKRVLSLDELGGRRLAVDGHGELYQFLALIRRRDGTPLTDATGRVTSHLVGLFYRTTRLVGDYGVELVYVFDGAPPALKAAELERRRAVKKRYEAEAAAARAAGDLARAYAKATMTSRLDRTMVDEARALLDLLGIPSLVAPGEGEAQAAHLARRGDVWAAASKDFDALLFGAPRLVRFLGVAGREFLPSRGAFRSVRPELVEAEAWLARLGITRAQLVDLAILVGTDFNEGIKGIGPKKALALVRRYGSIDAMPASIREAVAGYEEVRRIYLEPEVTDEVRLEARPPDRQGVVRFLCAERGFDRDRVEAALDRLERRGDGPRRP